MKILFDHASPFLLAHGGMQTQIEHTMAGLRQLALGVEPVRWWDGEQRGDVLHYFGLPSTSYLQLARQKNLPVIVTAVFSETCNRSDLHLLFQGIVTKSISAIPGGESIKAHFPWRALEKASRVIVGLEAERQVLKRVYGAPDSRITVMPLGLGPEFFPNIEGSVKRDHLITVGTICQVKQSIRLARTAKEANVPLLFVGEPFSRTDAYWREFEELIDNRFVLHRWHTDDRITLADWMRSARGFVLSSRFENWSLAAHEAAACGLPLLLRDMKWSRECFGDEVTYFDASVPTAEVLRQFYSAAASLRPPRLEAWSWSEVALHLSTLYREVSQSNGD